MTSGPEPASAGPGVSSAPGGVTLTLLGTGTPGPSRERAGSSYLVQFGGAVLLFDCGPGAAVRLLQAGRRPTEVSHLFLTHLHYDHCADFATLGLQRWDQGAGRISELAVIGPPGTARMTALLFGPGGAFEADIAARTTHPASLEVYERRGGLGPRRRPRPEVTELADAGGYAGAGWRVTAAQVVHCEPQLVTLAYRLETPAGTLVFGADTAPTPRLTSLARGADVLVHMCHFLNRGEVDARMAQSCSGHLDAARTAQAAGVGRLVLVHLTPEVEEAHGRNQLLAEAAGVFAGPITVGEDLLRLRVGGEPNEAGPVQRCPLPDLSEPRDGMI